jgi:SAM-dependent methyltransferase
MNYSQEVTQFGFVSAAPLPDVDELNKFYREMYYQNPQSSSYQETYPDWEIQYKRHRADTLLLAMTKAAGRDIRPDNDRYFDIGCGEGFALKSAYELGMKVFGCDFSEFGVKKFHPELADSFEAGDAAKILAKLRDSSAKFEFCSTLNVLEHVIDPVGFLNSIKPLLADDGVIAITVPNDFSAIQKKLQELGHLQEDFWFCPPHHLHYFNTSNLKPFVESCGYKVVDAFADFPIDLYLFHPGSNYITNPANGPAAHRARVEADMLLSQSGPENYLNLLRAMTSCGLGRNVTVILRHD